MRQVTALPFRGGVDEHTTVEWLDPNAQQRTVQNGVFTKVGAIAKRLGLQALIQAEVNGLYPSQIRKVYKYKDELAISDGNYLYSYVSSLATGSRWKRQSRLPECTATRTSIAQDAVSLVSPDVADGNGVQLFAWLKYSPGPGTFAVVVSVVDSLTGAYLCADVAIGAAIGYWAKPRAFILNGVAIVVWISATGVISAATLNLTNPTSWSGLTSLATDGYNPGAAAVSGFDACYVAGTSLFAIAYVNNAVSAPIITLRTFNSSLSLQATGHVTTETATTGINRLACCSTTGEKMWIAYDVLVSGTSTMRLAGANPSTLASSVSAFNLLDNITDDPDNVGVCRLDATNAVVTFGVRATSTQPTIYPAAYAIQANAIVTVVQTAFTYWMQPTSRPFAFNGRCYGLCLSCTGLNFSGPTDDITTMLVDWTVPDPAVSGTSDNPARPVATIAPRFTSGPIPTGTAASSIVPVEGSSTRLVTTAAVALGVGNTQRSGMVAVTLDFDHPGLQIGAELGESLYLAGGVPSIYDGSQVCEVGYLYSPARYSAAEVLHYATTGGFLAAQIYSYCFVWEWTDSRGQVHQSAPSIPIALNMTSSSTATNLPTITVPTYCLTMRSTGLVGFHNIQLVMYRTAFQNETMSPVFYRCTSADTPAANLNDPEVATITFTDPYKDTDIVTNQLLPTTGDVLESDCPSSFTTLCAHKGRIFGVGDDQITIWYSTEYIAGTPVRFDDDLTFQIADNGPVTALLSMDDVLVFFKRDTIYVMYGDGPSETNAGNDFTIPRRIASDVGCIEPRSVVLTPMGIMFQSPSGIYLLSRSLECQWIGIKVQDTTNAYPTITSAVMLGDEGFVLFTANTADGTGGVIIAYDYVNDAWGQWIMASPTVTQVPLSCAANVDGVYYAGALDGNVYEQQAVGDGAPYFDSGFTSGIQWTSWVTVAVETAWAKVTGFLGFSRVRSVQLLCENADPHNVEIQIATDYAATYAQSSTFTAATIATLAREELEVRVDNARCEAIRFRFSDAEPTGISADTGAGPVFIGLALDWIQRTGKSRLAPAARK